MRLAAYFGERERAGGRFLADAVAEALARHGVPASAILRGAEGFGDRHRRSDRLLTLSEDLPMLAVAIGPDLRAAADELAALVPLVAVDGDAAGAEAKLTAFVPRGAHEPLVAALHDAGVAGATAFLGIDGTLGGARRRARLRGGNRDVPTLVLSVGERTAIEAVAAGLEHATIDPVAVLRRDGARLADPPAAAAGHARLTVYAGEQTGVSQRLVRALRSEGAAGATALRGLWGYHGDHAPHGDRFWALRRHVPLVTTVVDEAERVACWLEVAAHLTGETGLVTWEPVTTAGR